MLFKKVAIAGVGLLGGSLGLALRQRKLAAQVTGLVRRRASLREVLRHGAADHATLDPAEAARNADLVVLATPVSQMAGLLTKLAPHLRPSTLVTDVGSVKAPLVRDLEELAGTAGTWFIGSHPMAGTEKTGVAFSQPDLFEKAVCVVTPTSRTPATGLRKIESLWRGVGARVLRLSPEEHDAVVSRTSHLVQLAAAALVHCVLGDGESGQRQARERLCAGGFRDTTRVASGSAEMWRDIALANRPNLLQGVDAYIRELKRFQDLLRRADAEGLHQFYGEAGRTRDAWLKKRQSGSARVRPGTAAKRDANAS